MAVRLADKPIEPARKLFGTDGIRGVANIHPMTGEMMLDLGRALAYLIRKGPHRHRVVIGKDTRLSGYMLETALASGLCSMGVDVMLCGPLPTPAISNLTVSMRADAGAVISASHNPYQDNGIKFFSRDGFKLPDEIEAQIEDLIAHDKLDHLRPTATSIGKAFRIDDAGGRYVVYAKSTFPKELTLEGLTIVVDCGHGAAYRVAPAVFEELGAKVIPIGVSPDGKNINKGFGALFPETLCKAVVKTGADLGIALAIASAFRDVPLAAGTVAFGELGLSGEVRSVSQPARRAAEATKLGFTRLLAPENARDIAAAIRLAFD